MEGLYVDQLHCLQIIVKHGSKEWIAYKSSPTAPSNDPIVTITSKTSPRLIELHSQKKKLTGFFDGEECITWENGEKWHRMYMSNYQANFLIRRPYIPITFLFMAIVCSTASHVYELCKGFRKVVDNTTRTESIIGDVTKK